MATMDWYSWLSKTNLDPSLVYEYSRSFTRNELQVSDTNYFNHEFLQSMGVSVAKHRLEILNLATNNNIRSRSGCRKNRFSKLMSAIINTRNLVSKKLGKYVSCKGSVRTQTTEPNPFRPQCRPQWPGVGRRKNMRFDEDEEESVRRMMKSGPLDRRVQERYVSPRKVASISGPLERVVPEKQMVMYSSPMDPRLGPYCLGASPGLGIPYGMVRSTSEEDELHSVWASMFQNMKPT